MRSLAIGLLASGCVYNWSADQSAFTVEGDAPSLDSFQKLNAAPAGLASLMTGPDGAPWTIFCEFWKLGGATNTTRTCTRQHLVRVDDTAADETINADAFVPLVNDLFVFRDDMATMKRTLIAHRPGAAAASDATFTVDVGPAGIAANDSPRDDEDVFAYFRFDPTAPRFDVFRRDMRFQRQLPIPMNVDPSKPLSSSGFRFGVTADGMRVVVRFPGGNMRAYDTLDMGEVDLGDTRPLAWFLDDDRDQIVTAGDDGLRAVPWDGRAEKLLWAGAVDPAAVRTSDDGTAWFGVDGGLWRVPLDGSAPATLAQANAARLLALGPNGEIAYSRDPADRYAGGAGDGWLGDWSYMGRGRLLRWSGDGKRLRFLEHAATIGVFGDLTSVTVPGGAPTVLGINVHMYAETDDGRVLAVENRVYAGAWNRLVVIDEAAGTKKWVVPSATEFLLVPDRGEVIADVVSGASGYDILRAKIPH